MPAGSYGLGSMFYSGRGKINDKAGSPGKSVDRNRCHFDGIECFCLFMPLAPLYAVHIWNWHKQESKWSLGKREVKWSYSAMPINWSYGLVIRSMLKVWLWLPLWFGLVVSAGPKVGILINGLGFLMSIFSGAGLWWVYHLDRTDTRIRRLLGRHKLGWSDPVYWTDELKSMIAPAKQWFGTASFEEACNLLIQNRMFSEAMWAARICQAIEDEWTGMELTRQILESCNDDKPESQRKEFPVLIFPKSESGDFWKEIYAGQSRAFFRETLFAANIIGDLTAATEREVPEDEIEIRQQRRLIRKTGEELHFRFMGMCIAGSIISAMVFLVILSFIV